MPDSLFHGMSVPWSTGHNSSDVPTSTLLDAHTLIPAGSVKAEGDLTVWQGEGVMGEHGVQLSTADYYLLITGHASPHGAPTKLAAAWFNTAFLPSKPSEGGVEAPGMFSLPKGALDKIFKDKQHALVSSHFEVHLLYNTQPSQVP
jgi:hypothetical protein